MDGLNHYAYCSANPINYTDPTGLSAGGAASSSGSGGGGSVYGDPNGDDDSDGDMNQDDYNWKGSYVNSDYDIDGDGIVIGQEAMNALSEIHANNIIEEMEKLIAEREKERDINKGNIFLRVIRDKNFNINDKSKNTFYNAKIQIVEKIDDKNFNILGEWPVQSWADIGVFSDTLKNGEYNATFVDYNANKSKWSDPIKFETPFGSYYVHPDKFTTDDKTWIDTWMSKFGSLGPWGDPPKPYSAGCQVMKFNDFVQFNYMLRSVIGFNNGDKITIIIDQVK